MCFKKNFVWTTWSTDWRNSGSFMTWNWLTINVSPTPWDEKKLLSPPSSLDPCRPRPSSPLNHPHLPHFQPSTSEQQNHNRIYYQRSYVSFRLKYETDTLIINIHIRISAQNGLFRILTKPNSRQTQTSQQKLRFGASTKTISSSVQQCTL